MVSAPPLSLKARAVQWLSQREHSRQELRRKLLQHLRQAARRQTALASARDAARTSVPGAERAPDPVWQARAGGPGAAVPALDDGCRVPSLSAADEAWCDASDRAADWEAEVDAVLDWLVAQRYLNEARFVESRVHVRGARYGNLRIKQELAQHGVALTPEQHQQLNDSELERACAVWSRKFGAAPADLRERARQTRFLAARGFAMAVVSRVLKLAAERGDASDSGEDADPAHARSHAAPGFDDGPDEGAEPTEVC